MLAAFFYLLIGIQVATACYMSIIREDRDHFEFNDIFSFISFTALWPAILAFAIMEIGKAVDQRKDHD